MARKPKPEAGKRYPLNMRTTRELRERIIAAAHASGRSLVQEVEYRLERSFEKEDQDKLVKAAAATAVSEAFKMIQFGKSPQNEDQGEKEKPTEHEQ
jgi:hypothetical protein